MKIGDIIYRIDAPFLQFRIVGDAKEDGWNAWYVEPLIAYQGFGHAFRKDKSGKQINKQMVFKDDDRWNVVK